MDYVNVDIVCDLKKLPFKENSVDAFVSRSVLEHVPKVWEVTAGLYRCMKPGGYGIHLIPFLFPFHASPGDFMRFTDKGAAMLFEPCNLVRQFNATGPVTLLLLIIIEWLSAFVACGFTRARNVAYLVFCCVFFPLKFLDLFFINNHRYMSLAPTILTVVKKATNENA